MFKRFFIIFTFLNYFCKCENRAILPSDENSYIFFSKPDLVLAFKSSEHSIVLLEAFKWISNDKILTEEANATSKLAWSSLGHPRLLNDSTRFFFNQEGFHTYVETLTENYQNSLVSLIKKVYSVNVTADQIHPIPLSKFECKIQISDETGGKDEVIKGEVRNFQTMPHRIDFHAPLSSHKRVLFQNRCLALNLDLTIQCEVAARGKLERQVSLTISKSELEARLALANRLFAKSEWIYFTKKQMETLSDQIGFTFNVLEDYHLTSCEFSRMFMDSFVAQISEQKFKLVVFEKAVDALFGSEEYSSTKIVIKELSRLFQLVRIGKNSVIKVWKERKNWKGPLSINSSVSLVRTKEQEWLKLNVSEQLIELNRLNEDGIKWELSVDEKIVPKFLKAAKLVKSIYARFGKLNFPNVSRKVYEEAFTQKFSLYTKSIKIDETGLESRGETEKDINLMKQTMSSQLSALNGRLICDFFKI
jgi:hypothetical protein